MVCAKNKKKRKPKQKHWQMRLRTRSKKKRKKDEVREAARQAKNGKYINSVLKPKASGKNVVRNLLLDFPVFGKNILGHFPI